MPIVFDFLANVNQFLRGTKDVDGALEDVADSLDDVARDGDQSTERLERSFKELADTAKRETARAAREMDDNISRGARNASDTMREVKSEALQNASETFSSFDGSVTSLVDGVQGTLGGLIAGLSSTGAGLPAAAAVAAGAGGIGLVTAGLQNVQKETEESARRAGEWADKFIESGERILGASQLAAEATSIATDPEKYKTAGENAKNWGVDVSTAIRAMAGDTTALEVVQSNLDGMADAMKRYGDARTAPTEEEIQSFMEVSTAWKAGADALAKQRGEMELGQQIAADVSDALKGIARDAGTATLEVDELGNQLYTLSDGTKIMIDADTGLATQNVDQFKGDLDGIPETVNTKVVAELDRSQIDNLAADLQGRRLKAYVDLYEARTGKKIP